MQAVLFLVLLTSFFGSPGKPPCTATGDLEVVPFESKVFPAPRNLRILLPAGYRFTENRHRRYPVLYLNDGQNLFDVCTSQFTGEEWRVDETVDDLIAHDTMGPYHCRNRQWRQTFAAEGIPALCRRHLGTTRAESRGETVSSFSVGGDRALCGGSLSDAPWRR